MSDKMVYTKLFIWVEGPDDERFFNTIVKPIFEEHYSYIEVRKYAERKNEYIISLLKSHSDMNDDYIFVGDINNEPCVIAKKGKLSARYRISSDKNILVVIMEIESWYYGGLEKSSLKQLKLRGFKTTNTLTKEQFNDLKPDRFDSRIDFMNEILKFFSIDNARMKNKSFDYFADKFGIV